MWRFVALLSLVAPTKLGHFGQHLLFLNVLYRVQHTVQFMLKCDYSYPFSWSSVCTLQGGFLFVCAGAWRNETKLLQQCTEQRPWDTKIHTQNTKLTFTQYKALASQLMYINHNEAVCLSFSVGLHETALLQPSPYFLH